MSESLDVGLDVGHLVSPQQVDKLRRERAKNPDIRAAKRLRASNDDVAVVERALAKLAPIVVARESANNAAYDAGVFPEWRLLPVRTVNGVLQPRKLNMELGPAKLLACNDPRLAEEGAVFVGYAELQAASNEEVDLSLLAQGVAAGNPPLDGLHMFLTKGNRETATLDYARRNAAQLLSRVPAEGGVYRLTPMQRIATALMLRRNADEDVCVQMKKRSGANGRGAFYRIAPLQKLQFMVNNLPVAAGKTWETVFATMSFVATESEWRDTQETFERERKVGSVMPHTGLTKMPAADCMLKVCRVVIALVPAPVMVQWEETSKRLAATYGKKAWTTWSGTSPLVRKSAKRDRVDRVRRVAVKITEETNCALFWVMEANTKSSFAATRTAAEYAIPFRIIDEGTGSKGTEPRSSDPESPCLKTIICNATLQQLQRHTTHQPTHPLRQALDGSNLDLDSHTHCAIMTMCSVPSWLRLATTQSLEPMMPQGIIKVSMRVRVTSLSGRINKTDMIISSTDDLIKNMVLNECASSMSPDQLAQVTAKCHAILNRTDAANSIADSLQSAIAAVEEDQAVLPPPQVGTAQAPLTQEQHGYNADIARQRRAFAKMQRLFKQLREAVCTDPPPECPVTLDVIQPKNVCILRCCGVFIDILILKHLKGKCPACRGVIDGVVNAAQVAGTLAKSVAAPASQPVAPVVAEPTPALNDVDALVVACKQAGSEKCGSSLDAVIKTIHIALRYKSKGVRILLCCSVFGSTNRTGDHARDESANTHKTCEFIRAAVPALASVSAIGKGGSIVYAYQNKDDTNRLLIVDTGKGSTTMAGLNLQNTDVLIFDRLNYGHSMDTARLVQTIGRVIRAQERTPLQRKADQSYYSEHGRSCHAPKIVVFIDRL